MRRLMRAFRVTSVSLATHGWYENGNFLASRNDSKRRAQLWRLRWREQILMYGGGTLAASRRCLVKGRPTCLAYG